MIITCCCGAKSSSCYVCIILLVTAVLRLVASNELYPHYLPLRPLALPSIANYPGVAGDLGQREAVGRFLLQQLRDQVLRVLGHARGEAQVDPLDPAVGGVVALRLKGGRPIEELVHQHAQAPNIHTRIVVLPLDHLRGEVVQGAAQGGPPAGWRMHGPPKVSNLQLAPESDQKILRLDITVNYMLAMAVNQSLRHLLHVLCRTPFTETATASEILVHFSKWRILKDEIDSLVIIEVTIHTENILVSEVGLNLNLSSQLMFHTSIQELFLPKNLQSNNILGLPFSC
mmetsp:Transcript_31384/g.45953  ORF Transcript_31384/g.45953 Transcript_31384/m.45953 type:complete len:286 (+) Transcript_31384:190-1047(+)